MIKHYPNYQLGKADHGWLKTRYHFSFAHYYRPDRMGFGALKVINDDIIAPQTGFPLHPHKNMEIVTYVRSGSVTHRDNLGNTGVTETGEVQVMSAGTGISHSEYNLSQSPLTLFQIWIEPNKFNVKPRWQSKPFPQTWSKTSLPVLVSGDATDEKTLTIQQDAIIYGGKIKAGNDINHVIKGQAYVLVSQGSIDISSGPYETITLETGDGAEITKISSFSIKTLTDVEMIVIDVPA